MAFVAGVAPSNLSGAAAMTAATGLFVINDSFMKAAMSTLPPFEVLFLRGVAAGLCCLAMMAMLGQIRHLRAMAHPAVLGRAVFETLGVLCYIVALANMPIADVIAITQTAPLMLILAAAFLMRERIGVGRLALIIAGFLGALLVAQPSSSGVSFYAVLAFATAAAIAARDLVGRRVPATTPGFVVIFATVLVVAAAAAVMTGLEEDFVAPSGLHLAYLGAAGLFVMLGHFAIFLAYRYGTAGAVAPFFYAFAIWAGLIGYVVWHETPNALALAGIAVIMASGLAIVLVDRRTHLVEPRGEIDL